MFVHLKNLFVLIIFFFLFEVSNAFAASGPLAKGFGADDWLDKVHVVLAVLGCVLLTTTILVFLILHKKNNDE